MTRFLAPFVTAALLSGAGCTPMPESGGSSGGYYDYDRIGAEAVEGIDTSDFDALE